MNNIGRNSFDIGYVDTLAAGDSVLHRLDPRAKLITTLVFIVAVVSFSRYALSSLTPFIIYPVVLLSVGGLPYKYLLKKVLLVLPFAILVGIFNPLMDRSVLIHIGPVGISGGWVSFISILLRAMLTVTAALILVSLTGFNSVCSALKKLGVPRPFVVQLLFFYRYVFVLAQEAESMLRARSLRAANARTMDVKTFVPLLGHLLLRTLDRAERIYLAMSCRGFDGQIRIIRVMKIGPKEVLFVAGWSFLFVFFRFYDIPLKLGQLMTAMIR